MKALHRRIVTSATYRQSSALTPELAARDATNAFYARGPRWRMTAEMVRAGATVIDVVGTQDISDATILIEGSRIAEVLGKHPDFAIVPEWISH